MSADIGKLAAIVTANAQPFVNAMNGLPAVAKKASAGVAFANETLSATTAKAAKSQAAAVQLSQQRQLRDWKQGSLSQIAEMKKRGVSAPKIEQAKQGVQAEEDARKDSMAAWKDDAARRIEDMKEFEQESAKSWGAWKQYGWDALKGVASYFTGGFAAAYKSLLGDDTAARKLGLSVLDLRAAMLWSGASAGSMASALAQTQGRLADLKAGTADATREFRGLSELSGVSLETLGAGNWATVYDAIARIDDPTKRAAQAFRFLGSEAGEFLDALDKGGAGGAADAAKRFGLAAGAGDVANVREIAKTLRELDAIKGGAFNQILLGLAPIVTTLKEAFATSQVNLEWIKPAVVGIAEGIGMFGAYCVEAAGNTKMIADGLTVVGDAAKGVFLEMKAVALDAISEIITAMNPLRSTVGSLLGPKLLGGLAAGGAVTRGQGGLVGVGGAAVDAITGADPGGLGRQAEEARKAAAEAREKSMSGVRTLGEQVAGSDSGKKVSDFFDRVKSRMGDLGAASREAMAPFQIDKLRQTFDAMSQGVKGPLDAWKQGQTDMQQMQKLGLFAGAGDTKALMAAKQFNDLRSGVGINAAPQLAGAAEANTKEAYSAVAQFRMQGERGNVQEQIRQALDIANQQRQAQIDLGKEVLKATQAQTEALAELEV